MRMLKIALALYIASSALTACAPQVQTTPETAQEVSGGSTGTTGGTPTPTTGGTATGTIVSISGQPAPAVPAGVDYSFTPTTNASGSSVSFTVSNAPAWATFDPKLGKLSGVPSAANVGTYPGILISVSDGASSSSLAAFSIQVTSGAVAGPSNPLSAATLAWDAPTSNVDGTPLLNLAGYRINYGTDATTLDHSVVINDGSLRACQFVIIGWSLICGNALERFPCIFRAARVAGGP